MNKLYKYIVFFIICIVGIGFNYNKINQFPQNIHCWAQCDRYAIALGFIDNHGDLLHPQTFVFNKQFPDEFNTASDNTITSVDFPIYDYCAYIIMQIFSTTEPWCFKLFTLLYSFIGFYFLFKLSSLFTSSKSKQLIILLFAITSPIIIYYQCGMLPSTSSLANTIIGLYYLFKYYLQNQKKHLIISIIFITIATLARLPFVIVIVAILANETLFTIKNKKINWFLYTGFLISIAVIFSYFEYNIYLRNTYGSLFLNSLMPANSYSEFTEIINSIYERWFLHYFSIYHYIIISISLLLFLYGIKTKKISINIIDQKLISFVLILFLGVFMFFYAMLIQFLNHDYYFIDTFYLPFILLFLFLITKMPYFFKNKIQKKLNYLLIIITAVPVFIHAKNIINYRETVFTPNPTAEIFCNADILLDDLKIPKNAKILTINEDGPNNPFILLKRKGFTVIWPEKEKIINALNWQFDYLVIANSKLISSIYTNYPEIKNQITKIGGNENISVYIKKKNKNITSVKEFLNINILPITLQTKITFDTIINKNTTNVDSLSNKAHTGKYAGIVTSKNEYGLTYIFKNVKTENKKNTIVYISSFFNAIHNPKELLICVSVKKNDKDLHFLVNDISEYCQPNNWIYHENIFNIPQINENSCDISIFIWNKGKNTILYDDIDISIY